MDLLSEDEIKTLLKNNFGNAKLIKWEYKEFDEKNIGYLGDHIKLILQVEDHGTNEIPLFVKCMPRNDEWKSEYLKEMRFFKKEYVMLSSLFKEFPGEEGKSKWRPKLYYIREDLFVFEDVNQLGYKMPHYRDTMHIDEINATVKALARFHAASYIHEERNSKKLGKPYRIWEDYKEYLQEPSQTEWRDTGKKAIKDFLKVFSKYKSIPDFEQKLDTTISKLFNGAWFLMQPSNEYRNVVVHRDLWTNNIFIRHQDNGPHILFVDFQTVLYASPMLDLTSLLYFNTNKSDRKKFGDEFIHFYYDALRSNLDEYDIDINDIFNKDVLLKSYKESVVFGITQASLIVPITAMDSERKEEIFCDPDRIVKANMESRSEEFIETANNDIDYRNRVIDLLDDIVETFVLDDFLNCNNHSKPEIVLGCII